MMLKLETRLLQMLTAVLLASMWSSFVHCRVIGQLTDEGESDMDSSETSWPVLCPANTFFDQSKERCTECSQCPINEVIISPCGGLANTKCGPLFSFDIFKKSSHDEDHDAGNQSPRKTSEADADAVTGRGEGEEHDSDGGKAGDTAHPTQDDETPPSEVETVTTEWKSLSLTLIIILTVVLAIFAAVVVAVCYVRAKSTSGPSTKEASSCEYQPAPTKI